MTHNLHARLLGAVYACMRPLARLLLRSGITYKSFAEISKQAFVHEAMLEKDSKGRITNMSRIAVRTGLSRKEVRRVFANSRSRPNERSAVDHSGPPARVLYAWHSDPRFLGEQAAPMDLPFEGETQSFTELVRAVGGDVPPGAVRAELLRAAAVIELENGLMRPTKRYFVPGDFDEKAITILTQLLFPMISGVDHNSNPGRRTAGFIQRFSYGKLPMSERAAFRAWSRVEGTKFIEGIDDWLISHEAKPSVDFPGDEISGVGVFFYEGPEAEGLPSPSLDE